QPEWMSSTISRSEVFQLPQMFNQRTTHNFLLSTLAILPVLGNETALHQQYRSFLQSGYNL
ncbi:MAG: hypothetical protein ACKO3K_09845, partial [Cuspidothrix sp.]